MTIQPKDMNMLWGKAAGHCSMPDCRKPLVHESEDQALPKNKVLIGEMAHIVGEKKKKRSPRGLSSLELDERNKYSNLILLCRNHHKIIDSDEASWTVEKLHIVKREHELWIEQRLGKNIDANLRIYNEFIDLVAIALDFENWEWLCDHLFRTIMPTSFPDQIYRLDLEYFRAIMPGIEPELETELNNIVKRSRTYLDHYLSQAQSKDGDPRIMAIRAYRDAKNHNEEDDLLEAHNQWELKCTKLLFNLAHAMNEFSSIVRSKIRSDFFIHKGKFCVHDFQGIMKGAGLNETWHIPEVYFSEKELNAPPG